MYSEKAKSHLQFVSRPEVLVDVEPVIGDKVQINLKLLPFVAKILQLVVDKEISDLVQPKFLILPIPCVNESFKIDREGRIIS